MTEKHKEHHHKEEKKSDTLTIDKVSIWKIISAILGVLLIVSIFTGGFGSGGKSAAPANIKEAQAAQPRQQAPSAPSIDMTTLTDDDAFKGNKNAPVTIVEWSDFECPFCTRFYQQTLGQIKKEYINTGKVKFIYRDFPLGFHANAQKSAEAAECAGEQGKFWEMHDKLFEEGVSGGLDSFKQFAVDIGLNAAKFNECLDSGKMASEVAKDMQDGQAVGISGTPGFIINGQKIVGAQPFEAFKQIIDAELAK
ncbi:MAG: DsbA family protein [Pseudomonadota bacterium]